MTMEAYHTYVLSIGSNVSRANVEAAIKWLRAQFGDIKVSHVYETPAISSKEMECSASSVYNNSVACVDTLLDYAGLESLFKTYELERGRDAQARAAGVVPIDIDIVVADGMIIRPWDYRQQFFKIGLAAI